MSRTGVKNKVVNVRKTWYRRADEKTCVVCGSPVRHSGFEKYCSRECYRAAFRKHHASPPGVNP
jgi:hypothetical protein